MSDEGNFVERCKKTLNGEKLIECSLNGEALSDKSVFKYTLQHMIIVNLLNAPVPHHMDMISINTRKSTMERSRLNVPIVERNFQIKAIFVET